jgi:hypothetical protein|tara:strand:+ start:2006 stop:2221 length:216 start_codon:yes stop_codon:yes gene_type:complete
MSKKDSKFKGVNDNYLSREINHNKGRGRPTFKMIGDWRREWKGEYGSFQEFKKMKERKWRQENRNRRKSNK